MASRVVDLHDWQNRVNAFYIKHRRWWAFIVDPIGPSIERLQEDSVIRRQEDGLIVRHTEGA